MYIQEIIIDGFKSYATKTVISGFDSQFNAITGLNGSGKSNILDAICFVLGISNLTQVRVGNLQELVYKQGQAGVTKASVTIIFNNSDPSSSPLGYEQCTEITVTRQVVIGGKNKYLINGHSVQQSQVQNLFHSVQLNVNNPHFLIMQGRITKVLNMKPPEILAMLEEAAGTRMFETKKQGAIKTLEKKQQKVDELARIMENDIGPRLEQLREEKEAYLEWTSTVAEIERLEKVCVAHSFYQSEQKVSKSETGKEALEKKIVALALQRSDLQSVIEELQVKISSLTESNSGELSRSLESAKQKEQEISKMLVKCNTMLSNQKELYHNDSEQLANLLELSKSIEEQIQKKTFEIGTLQTNYGILEANLERTEQELAKKKEQYQNACAGITNEEDANVLSLSEQIGYWEKKQRDTQIKLQQEILKRKHHEERVNDLRKQTKIEEVNQSQNMEEVNKLKEKISIIDQQLLSFVYCERTELQLRKDRDVLLEKLQMTEDRRDSLRAQVETRLSFTFENPEKGFDRNRVKGMVAKLVTVIAPQYSTALEVVAAGKLYQVVVDTEQTGASLLKYGKLKHRVTLIPLNKVSGRGIDAERVQASKNIASAVGEHAHLALELVGFENEVRRAMQYVFGNAIICSTSKAAEAIAFNKNIRCKTVTLDGDSYDPSGTITGGSKNQIGLLLSKVAELASLEDTCRDLCSSLNKVTQQLSEMKLKSAHYKELTNGKDILLHSLKMMEEQIQSSKYALMMDELKSLEKELDEFEQNVQVPLLEASQAAAVQLEQLALAKDDVNTQREKAFKTLEKAFKLHQKDFNREKDALNEMKVKVDKAKGEMDLLVQEAKSIVDTIDAAKKTSIKFDVEIISLEKQIIGLKKEYDATKTTHDAIQKDIQQQSKEIRLLNSAVDQHVKTIQNLSLEARKAEHELNNWKKEIKEAEKKIVDMKKKYAWVALEKKYFGLSGTDYDFNKTNPDIAEQRYNQLKEAQEKLVKKINKKVLGMIDKAESESKDLLHKREVIMNDKSKIESVIQELDVKKAEALRSTWLKVNKDFGSIFSTLLPGAEAKLDVPEGQRVMDGLEVKVAFNGTWKDSLTELSGGQRSLLALSLILAMLLFKPAPMYILDEVDAALDLSHTQNIGLMLRNHFSTSQFIVVSLKEGMFNNANVIFRTRFVDGVSTVSRTVIGSKNIHKSKSDITNEIVPDKKKKRGNVVSERNRELEPYQHAESILL